MLGETINTFRPPNAKGAQMLVWAPLPISEGRKVLSQAPNQRFFP
jgi:hypothetical protein